ncbi:MAG: hypothetical protein ABWZ80_04790 [Beijerinckiaceae bacterium]
MLMLLSFTPFLAFSLLSHFVSADVGLWVGAALALALVLSDLNRPDGSAKLLEIGCAVVFCILAPSRSLIGWPGDATVVRIVANGALMGLALLSLVARRPFTLQYAREVAPIRAIEQPAFVSANYAVTAVWAAAFALMLAANYAAHTHVIAPLVERLAVGATIVAAFSFTYWYAMRTRRILRRRPGAAESQPSA